MVTVKQSELRSASFDKKLFSVLDKHSNILSVNDNVRVLDGLLKVSSIFYLKASVMFIGVLHIEFVY